MTAPTKKILISQPEPTSGRSPYYSIAEKYGYSLEFRQLIKVVTVEPAEFRRQRVDILAHTAVILSSKSAIDNFFTLTKELRLTIPESMKYFCPSESIALYLQKYIVYRKRKVFFGENGQLTDLLATIAKHPKETYFLPVSENPENALFDMLNEKKITFNHAIMYRTVTRGLDEEPMAFDHDIILFFSPYGIKALKELCPDFEQGDKVIGAFSTSAAEAVEQAGLRLDFAAPVPGVPSMPAALDLYLSQHAEK
ncbi:uroporphyrinogen-III synthase [Porphyromonas circumdentaria]|uniref:Uroporphyrinogen-III synthase n=1 Tax=Porphyromonas circumdentaria TaxID=29524 RepID=A0A1T4NT61_9PORP|nr:uroporphyrinogen-III synthase [Porphyromonas circumdentaria]MBB6276195.1 uroporphyrinogen-III synthase [Porphyromonas circumdentaria]MDO4722318.1 uroporphyrinogen-III synthase [Porphyromonas circumdentaria]SJZ82550.1 uroporphyrinogen-III synthase [Porphyromonas circumdentaria]